MPNAQSAKKNIDATETMVRQTGGPGMKMARPSLTKPAQTASRKTSKKGK